MGLFGKKKAGEDKAAAIAAGPADMNGLFKGKVKTPVMEKTVPIRIQTDGGETTGSYDDNPFTRCKVEGNHFEAATVLESPIGQMEVTISGDIAGDTMTAVITNPMMSFNYVGKRC